MTQPTQPTPAQGPSYRGAPLDAAQGPGLGCFRFQIILLLIFVVATPIGVASDWPLPVTSALLFLTLILLFFVGQTAIFLLRLVAADRRSRRRPLAPTARRTVGDLEAEGEEPSEPSVPSVPPVPPESSVRQ